jgi:RHS repeat-associated protein
MDHRRNQTQRTPPKTKIPPKTQTPLINPLQKTPTQFAVRSQYNAYGKLVSETNSAVDLIFGFTGKQLDEATGLQHNLFRWYDSNLGQWLSEDPISFAAGDENVRRYVGNRIVSDSDIFGLYDDDAYNDDVKKAIEEQVEASRLARMKPPTSEPQSNQYNEVYEGSTNRFYIDEKVIEGAIEAQSAIANTEISKSAAAFDCEDYAIAMSLFLEKGLTEVKDAKIHFLSITGKTKNESGHIVVIVGVGSKWYLVDPQTGIVTFGLESAELMRAADSLMEVEYKKKRPLGGFSITLIEEYKEGPYYDDEGITKLFVASLEQAGASNLERYFPPDYKIPEPDKPIPPREPRRR